MIAFFRCCRSSHLIKRSSTSLFSTASSQPGDFQRTLLNAVSRSGIGLHTGITAQVRLLPAPAGVGRYFVHLSDDGQSKEEEVQVPASIHSVKETNLSTCIGQGDVRIRTIEHLLSALEGLGVHNCRIEIHGGNEVPLLDGSAKTWVDAIHEAGITFALDDKGDKLEHINFSLMEPVYVSKGDYFVAAFPSQDLRITYGIDFCEVPAIGNQWFSIHLDKDSTYMREISPARTFCIREQIEKMRAAGLIKGGSMDNAIICSMSNGWLNPPLRFTDEPCRHKLLDLIGDLALCSENGNPGLPIAHIVAFKASHWLHIEFGNALLKAKMNQHRGSK